MFFSVGLPAWGKDGSNMLRRTFLAGAGAAALSTYAGPSAFAQTRSEAERAYPPIGEVITVDGLAVHAAEFGSGGPPVVLLHGASVNLRDWTFSHARALAARRRVIAMDRPGFGYSERGPGRWPPTRQAGRLRAAAKAMGVERPILVGHSWGAIVALAWALSAPDEVSGVVTVSGATMPWGAGVALLDGLGVGRYAVRRYMNRLARNAENGSIERFVARAFRPQTPPQGYLDYVGAPLTLRAATLDANSEDLAQTHSALLRQARAYRTLDVPVEIVHGDRDWLLSVDRHAERFAERLPNARMSIARGVGHMAHHARPDLVEAAIARISAEAG